MLSPWPVCRVHPREDMQAVQRACPPFRACCIAAEPTPEEARRLSKAQRRRQKAANERAVQQQERALAAGEQGGPQSAAEHEQAVMAQPDASVAWIQYMAFLISLGEVEKARGLAERAVQTINYRWDAVPPQPSRFSTSRDAVLRLPMVVLGEAGTRLQASGLAGSDACGVLVTSTVGLYKGDFWVTLPMLIDCSEGPP